jgi:hypothetical protein
MDERLPKIDSITAIDIIETSDGTVTTKMIKIPWYKFLFNGFKRYKFVEEYSCYVLHGVLFCHPNILKKIKEGAKNG